MKNNTLLSANIVDLIVFNVNVAFEVKNQLFLRWAQMKMKTFHKISLKITDNLYVDRMRVSIESKCSI